MSETTLKEQLRLSILAQEELRRVVSQQAADLSSLREFSEVEREAMVSERSNLLQETDSQVRDVKILVKDLQQEKNDLNVQIQLLESALASAASDRANVEAAAQTCAATAHENAVMRKEVNELKSQLAAPRILPDENSPISADALKTAAKEVCLVDGILL